MLYVGLPEGGRLFFTMISTVCAISERAGVSAWMVSAFLRIARMVTGMDMHLRRGGDNCHEKADHSDAPERQSVEISPVNNFGDEFVGTN